MEYTIENEILKISVETLGAQLSSIYSKKTETEYLWQGDGKYWKGRAYNLFPYVGRFYDGKYSVYGKEYEMDRHGFARGSEFVLREKTENSLTFTISATENTLTEYPFEFIFSVKYLLTDNKLRVLYTVENVGDKAMYFGLGGHPGFNVPFGGGEFEDYFVEFEKECKPIRILANEKGLITSERAEMDLQDGKKIELRHCLFDEDAIIMETECRAVSIKSGNTVNSVKVTFPQMPYLGIWHMPKTDAPYICIEPWLTLPSNDGKVEELETKTNVGICKVGEVYENYFDIQINE
ncbi:MAG: aldose 1-epimerase family protein [Clostridiales bacterium]|nr:aldose 1-epimerase family protein [Clostridiales bacterium]